MMMRTGNLIFRRPFGLLAAASSVFALACLCLLAGCAAETAETSSADAQAVVQDAAGGAADDEAGDADDDARAESFTAHGSEYGKSETVAVKTDLAGEIDSIAVDEWVKNPEGLKTVLDVSNLQNIVAEDDGVTYERDGEAISWNADGADVVYSGTSDRKLPFAISYRYQLDGVEVDPATLQDATGELCISISYQNNTSATVSTGWQSYDVQDPYLMASIIQFDPEHVQDVEVDNGSVIDQQDAIIAVGIGMPGLGRTLGVEDDVDLPESVQITAQVKGFDMPDITTVATDQMLGRIDRETTDDVQGQLDDAIGQLDNIATGIDALSKGNEAIATATDMIAQGETAIAEALPQASGGIQALAQVADASSQAVASAVETAGTVSQNVQTGSSSLDEAQEAASSQQEALSSMEDAIDGQRAALKALKSVDTDGMSDSQKEALASAIEGLEASLDDADDAQAAAKESSEATQDALDEAQESLDALTGEDGALQSMVQEMTTAQMQSAALSENLGQAAEGIQTVQEGTEQLAEAITQVSAGSKKLGKAAGKMSDAVSEAIETVQSSIDEKVDLVNALSDYVNAQPAYGGSAEDMPASTIYLVHAKSELTPLR